MSMKKGFILFSLSLAVLTIADGLEDATDCIWRQCDFDFEPYPLDCNKYLRCVPGNRICKMNCPPGLVWNQDLKTCDWSSDCEPSTYVPFSTSTTIPSSSSISSTSSSSSTSPSTTSSTTSSTSTTTSVSTNTPGTCPWYNTTKAKCTEEGDIPDPESSDNSTYITCTWDKNFNCYRLTKRHCPKDLFFSVEFGSMCTYSCVPDKDCAQWADHNKYNCHMNNTCTSDKQWPFDHTYLFPPKPDKPCFYYEFCAGRNLTTGWQDMGRCVKTCPIARVPPKTGFPYQMFFDLRTERCQLPFFNGTCQMDPVFYPQI